MPLTQNPLLSLAYEPAFESLGPEYSDPVKAAEFPLQVLRFRNDGMLPRLGLEPAEVGDRDFIEAFGAFWGRSPLLAMRYHGYQFGQYNPQLGDGRGFLYGQVRGSDGLLYDLGTKGSGTTPYSRQGDGRLTLKGGIREVLAAETLYAQGVRTSRTLSLIETGEQLYRGDEPSPTRSSVMVRMQRSHIRFGTFERLHYLGRPDLIQRLLDHAIATYYPELVEQGELNQGDLNQGKLDPEAGLRFYAALVTGVAQLSAQWTAVGFCHAVLNTDNMVITAESFDYGPYAFLNTYDPRFTAAYFDVSGRYCYGNQPGIGRLNLELLQAPLGLVLPKDELDPLLGSYDETFRTTYRQGMLDRLGLGYPQPESGERLGEGRLAEGRLAEGRLAEGGLGKSLGQTGADQPDSATGDVMARFSDRLDPDLGLDLVRQTLLLLQTTQVGYHDFFAKLRHWFSPEWRDRPELIPSALFCPREPLNPALGDPPPSLEACQQSDFAPEGWDTWRSLYHSALTHLSDAELHQVRLNLAAHIPLTPLVRPNIETVWEAIAAQDDWQPFYDLLTRLQHRD